MVPGIAQRHVTARDGTRIGYQVRGDGPCVVLANGLGGTYVAFRHLYEALDRLQDDLLGLPRAVHVGGARRSAGEHDRAPGRRSRSRSSTQEGVDDVRDRGLVDGRPGRVRDDPAPPRRGCAGMFAINGTYGRAFRTVMGSRLLGRTIPMLLRLVRAQAALAGVATKRRRRLRRADRRDEARRAGVADDRPRDLPRRRRRVPGRSTG